MSDSSGINVELWQEGGARWMAFCTWWLMAVSSRQGNIQSFQHDTHTYCRWRM